MINIIFCYYRSPVCKRHFPHFFIWSKVPFLPWLWLFSKFKTKKRRNLAWQVVNKRKKKTRGQTVKLTSRVIVGITGLEPATSRPPDVCATNCAKSRLLMLYWTFADAKVWYYFEMNKYLAFFCSFFLYFFVFLAILDRLTSLLPYYIRLRS